MKPILGFKALAYVVLLSAGIWAGITEAAIITFSEFNLMHGDSINTSVNSQYLTNFGLTITADNFYIPDWQEAVIFDNTETGTRDDDLENLWSAGNISADTILGNLLIIQEEGSPLPDDEGRRPAGSLHFKFDTPIKSFGFDLIDVEGAEEYNGPLDPGQDNGYFAAFYTGGSHLAMVGFGEFDNSESSNFQDAVYGNNTINRIQPITAADLSDFVGNPGEKQFDRVEINFGGSAEVDNIRTNPIPEPATMLMVGSGLIILAGIGRKKFLKKKGRKGS